MNFQLFNLNKSQRRLLKVKTRIFVVRHTETVGNIEKRLTGRQEYEITDRGNQLIKQLTNKLKTKYSTNERN